MIRKTPTEAQLSVGWYYDVCINQGGNMLIMKQTLVEFDGINANARSLQKMPFMEY